MWQVLNCENTIVCVRASLSYNCYLVTGEGSQVNNTQSCSSVVDRGGPHDLGGEGVRLLYSKPYRAPQLIRCWESVMVSVLHTKDFFSTFRKLRCKAHHMTSISNSPYCSSGSQKLLTRLTRLTPSLRSFLYSFNI